MQMTVQFQAIVIPFIGAMYPSFRKGGEGVTPMVGKPQSWQLEASFSSRCCIF